MSLLDDIRNAQVRAGEGAVIARLQKLGLVDKPKAEKDPRDTEIERLRADAARWLCVRDTLGSELLMKLMDANPGPESDAVVDMWIATGGREGVAALRGEADQ